MILGSTMQQPGPRVSPPHHKRSPRPDSPGGYFTLSDSDGASNPGTESSEENGPSPRSTTPMYKIFKNSQLRSRSEPPPSNFIPPRPSPPKDSSSINVENDEVGPPRPPPPLSYTSTLPPPVPKKMNKMRSQSVKNRLVNPPPPPPPLAHFGGPRPKPLQRVQPLQIQSPSMINILQGNSHRKQNSTSSNSSDDNSIESKRSEPVSFVKTFQKAASTSTYNGGNSDLRPRPVLKKKAETAGYMRPTKTAVLKQNDHVKNARKSSSSCGSSSSSETENDKKQKKVIRKSPSSSSESDNPTPKKSRSSGKNGKKSSKNTSAADNPGKFKKLKNTVNELKRSASEKVVVIKNSAVSDSKECKNDVKTEAKPASENETALFKNPIQSLIKFYEDSQVDKRKVVAGNKELVVLEDKDEAADKDTKRISVTSSKSTNTSHLSQISQLSAEKIQSWLNNPMVSLEQDWSVTEVNILDQYVTDMISMTEVVPPKVPKVPVIPTLVTTPRDEIIKRNVVIDIKCEDDIIVPNVSATTPKRAKSSNCDINSNRIEVKKLSEKNPKSPKIKRKSITVIEDKIPSEEEISHGVFTEVSCAGNVTQKKIDLVKSHFENAPIPSPRVKKKARKEQMLLEHKEKGREALSLVMKQLKSEPTPTETLTALENNNENDGLQCLDDLCTQSRYVEEDIKKHQQNNAATKSQASCVSKDDQVGVGQSYRLNP